MTRTQKFLARHALGFNQSPKPKRSYRNHFVVGPGSPDHHEWSFMVHLGWAAKTRASGTALYGGDDCFYLTRTGAELALAPGEKLCEEDFPPPQLSKRAQKMLARLKGGHFYGHDKTGPTMQELIDAGLVVRGVRYPIARTYWVPKGFKSHYSEEFPQ